MYTSNDDYMSRGMNALPQIRVVLSLVYAACATAASATAASVKPASARSTPGAATTDGSTAPAATASACAGVANCHDAGPFSAAVTSATESQSGRNHVIDMNIRFTDRSSQPVILAYTEASSSTTDNLGNRYYWGRAGGADQSVKGIDVAAGTHTDPQFALGPGESRDATFSVVRFDVGNSAIGSAVTYDVGIEQLDVLASQLVRSSRQYAVHFDILTTGAAVRSKSSAAAATSVPSVTSATDAVNKLKGLFKKP